MSNFSTLELIYQLAESLAKEEFEYNKRLYSFELKGNGDEEVSEQTFMKDNVECIFDRIEDVIITLQERMVKEYNKLVDEHYK